MVKKSEEMIEHEHKNCSCGEECKCKRIKKSTWMIISLLVIVLVFCVGLGVGTFILEGGSSDKCVEKLDEKDNKNEDEYTVKLFNEKNENYKDISLKTEEDVEKFISQFSWMGDFEVRKDFFTGKDYLKYIMGYIFNSYDWVYGDNDVIYISQDFLESEINKVFDYSFDDVFFGEVISNGGKGYNISCDYDGLCKVFTIPGGGTRVPFYEVIVTDKKERNNEVVYTIKEYYLQWSEEEDGCFIKTEENGKVLAKLTEGCSSFDSSKLDYNQLNTYEITFDKNNKLISSKKIS